MQALPDPGLVPVPQPTPAGVIPEPKPNPWGQNGTTGSSRWTRAHNSSLLTPGLALTAR